ncbi:MAG: hypothetical protein LBJ94_00125 [Puniceicoccales bacterium]|jgi:hypothetical protein|nr:hypothetical protein [Puniceicoccales bacterium]
MPIEIVNIGERGSAFLKIGDIPAGIFEPKAAMMKVGLVYVNTVDFKNGKWENLIHADLDGHEWKGCSRDPRLLEIAEKVFTYKLSQEDVGKIYPPLGGDTSKK